MWFRVYVYKIPEVKKSTYEETKHVFDLVPHIVEQYFRTSWYQLNETDRETYENLVANTDYQKLYISNKEGLEFSLKIYEGKPLTYAEMQSKVKEWSRIDEAL